MALTEKEELELLELEEAEYQDSLKAQKNTEPFVADTAVGSALQGATFGFGDELTAAGAALTDIAVGDPKLNDYKDLYNKYLQDERQQLKLEAEANPKTALGAGLAGGLMTAMVPGAGMLNTVKGATAAGAATGLGMSEATSLPEVAQDVGYGAAGGAILSKALPLAAQIPSAVGKTVKGAGSFVADLPLVRDVVDAAQGAFQGKTYSGADQVQKYQSQIRDTAQNTIDLLKELSLKKAGQKSKVIEEAVKEGKTLDIAPDVLETYKKLKGLGPSELSTKEARKAAKELEKLTQAEFEGSLATGKNVKELDKVAKNLQSVIDSNQTNTEARQYALDLLSKIKSKTQELSPDLKNANQEIADTMGLFERFTGKSPKEYIPGMNVADNAAMLDRASRVLSRVDDEPTKVNDLVEGILGQRGLKDYAPDVADYVKKSSTELARDLDLARKASGDVKFVGERLSTLSTKLGESAGKMGKFAKDSALATIKNVTPNFMENTALRASQQFGETGKKLSNILMSVAPKGEQQRTAVMFSLMQNPEYREILEQLNPMGEGE
jgi:hypothetical protein